MALLKILKSKNRLLRKLYELSEKNLQYSDEEFLENLSGFENGREKILKTLALYDKKVNEIIAKLEPEHRTRVLIDNVRASIQAKDKLLENIIQKDDLIMKKIENLREKIIQEASQERKNKSTMSKFKSKWVSETGEGVDKRL